MGVGLRKSIALGALLSTTLSGCTSLAGSQPRFIDVRQPDAGLDGYRIREALLAFSSDDPALRDNRTPERYRDDVVRLYLMAIEAIYADFRTQVSSERRAFGLGFDLVTLGYTNYATVADESIVNDLAAIASGFGGARGALDRNVYFDRALPALLATMDAHRTRIIARIEEGLGQAADDYPLSAGFRDLRMLESAGSIDRAIEDATARAAGDRQAAEDRLAEVVQACEAEADVVTLNRRLSDYARTLAAAEPAASLTARTQKLRQVAAAMNLPPNIIAGNPDDIRRAVLRRLSGGEEGRCAAADVEQLIARVEQQTGDTIP